MLEHWQPWGGPLALPHTSFLWSSGLCTRTTGMGSSLWKRLLPEAMRVHRLLALEKVRGANSLESISWEPNQMKNKRGCVLSPDLPCRIPGDRKARQIQKDYTPPSESPALRQLEERPRKEQVLSSALREGALGEAL